jgi:hypothetical protein
LEKIIKNFQPPSPRTEKFLAVAANGEKQIHNFLAATADKGIGLHLYLQHLSFLCRTILSGFCVRIRDRTKNGSGTLLFFL